MLSLQLQATESFHQIYGRREQDKPTLILLLSLSPVTLPIPMTSSHSWVSSQRQTHEFISAYLVIKLVSCETNTRVRWRKAMRCCDLMQTGDQTLLGRGNWEHFPKHFLSSTEFSVSVRISKSHRSARRCVTRCPHWAGMRNPAGLDGHPAFGK